LLAIPAWILQVKVSFPMPPCPSYSTLIQPLFSTHSRHNFRRWEVGNRGVAVACRLQMHGGQAGILSLPAPPPLVLHPPEGRESWGGGVRVARLVQLGYSIHICQFVLFFVPT
jgi:hypothetical protein